MKLPPLYVPRVRDSIVLFDDNSLQSPTMHLSSNLFPERSKEDIESLSTKCWNSSNAPCDVMLLSDRLIV